MAAASSSRPSRQINIVLRNADQDTTAGYASAADPSGSLKSLPQSGPWAEWHKELDRLVGLDDIKELVYEIYALL